MSSRSISHVDVCIIGAGPAGALIAYKLSNLGYDIVMLEAGKRFDEEPRGKKMERSLRPYHHQTEMWDMQDSRDAYTSSGPVDYPVNLKRAKGVGGSTLHWGGRVARFTEKDFEVNSRYGVAFDWPISYADLKPYYAEAEREFGVAGTADNEFAAPRDEPYPMEAFPSSYSDSLFVDACNQLGIQTHSVPNARNSEAYDGRPPCVGYGTCSPACPSGAKYTAETHIDKAEANGARIVDRAVVQRLRVGESASQVTGAVYTLPDGKSQIQTADVYVLAAGAVENARLLLMSRSATFPDGLANSSGVVGKYFMEHPYVGIIGRLDRETSQNRIGFGTTESYQFYESEDPPPGSFKIEFSNAAGPTLPQLALNQSEPIVNLVGMMNRTPGALKRMQDDVQPIKWGDELLAEIESSYGNWFKVDAQIEVLPTPENRVTLNQDKTDKFGNPVPDVSWGHFTTYAEQTMERAFDVIEDVLSAMDAEVVTSQRFSSLIGAGHSSGTTRMGTDPQTSVVDRNQQSHDLSNLFIAGASTFVTIGASQPTLTIGATSLRLADYLSREVL